MVTADNLTDTQIRDFLATLPADHYAVQWCLDAQWDTHRQRKRNARRELASLINARAKESR
jgi:hypothetical protein